MAAATLGTVLHYLRRSAVPHPGDGSSDGQLLDSFLRERDEIAFAALLSRHGPMVLGVCRRILGNSHDAEDAFQATFLVLVRRAEGIRRHGSLGNWLYGVALRTARRAKLDAARRRRREGLAAVELSRPAVEPDWRDLRAALDEEIAGLPEKYRHALVLCHVEGQTNAQAARRLRIPLGSLSKRLARARGLLRGRLLRRGVSLSAAAVVTVLAGQATAVPPLLARTATGNALLALAGSAAVPVPLAALSGAVARTLFADRVRAWLLGLAVLGLLIGGGLMGAARLAAPPVGGPQERSQPAPAEKEPARDEAKPSRKDLDAVKQRLLLRAGGSAKSEAAVAAGLLWIVKQQAADGHWSLDAPGGQKNDIAGTAFGLLPLLGAGHTPTGAKDPFAKNIRRGLDFLLSCQKKDGDFGGGMYAQALASCALFEAYALTGEAKLKAPAQLALDYIIKAQHEAGGWRYTPRQAGDLSVTVWQVAALHDARAAGFDVPKTTTENAARFVRTCAAAGGGYHYFPGVGTSRPTMTAAGLLCVSHLGENIGDESFRNAVHELAKMGAGEKFDTYYLHWAAELLRRHGGDGWEKWNVKVRDALISRQKADGGWPVEGEPFGQVAGRIMVTSLAVLTLEVYYRDDLLLSAGAPRVRAKADLERLWTDLASDDSIRVRRAVWSLADAPRESVPLLKELLTSRPRPAVDAKQIARYIVDLDDDDFAVREKASAALKKLGPAAGAEIRKALKKPGSAESRRRLEVLVSGLEGARFTPERKRLLRAVEVLEYVGNPEAQRVLRELAKESDEFDVAREAEAALKRLAEPNAEKP